MSAEETGELAKNWFGKGWSCAESVLQVLSQALGIESALIPRISTGFGSGMARLAGPCGAISGAVMGIGLAYGRNTGDGDREYAYALIQEFVDRFTKRFGATGCRELTGCDFNTEEGQRRFMEQDIEKMCRDFCGHAAQTAIELMIEGV